jgi:hypothetical protein
MRSYSINSSPLGKTWQEWIETWWRWCYTDQLETSPASDRTGNLCGKDQTYDKIWFLAGTFGGRANRRCVMPRGRSLFFPVLNDLVSFATDPGLKTEEELTMYARADLDTTKSLRVIIDGDEFDQIWNYRVRTSPFELTVPLARHNGEYVQTRAVSDGFWIFMYPLGKGRHTIYFTGEKSEFDRTSTPDGSSKELPVFRVEVEYNLTVC